MILSFQQRFVPAVTDGTKPHTIRAGRRWRVGMGIQFYENARQASMRKFRPDAVATVVQAIRIERQVNRYRGRLTVWPTIRIDSHELQPMAAMTLANTDGFDDVVELVAWFEKTHGLPFNGQLIGWTDLRY